MKGEYTSPLTRSMKGKNMSRTVSLASMMMYIMLLVFAGEHSAIGATAGDMQPTLADGNNSVKEDCDDHNACTIDSFYVGAGCFHIYGCDDANACTMDLCDPLTGCYHEGINCDDANACTIDYCEPNTGCVHEPLDCNDYNPATVDTCDPWMGCTYTPINCEDNNTCTIDTTDGMGGCLHIPIDCNDGDPYTQDLCDPVAGCIHTVPPDIMDIVPSQGPVSGGIEITITGAYFHGNGTTQVLFDAIPATNVQFFWRPYDSSYITCILPSHLPGTVDVTVINPDGGRGTSPAAFTYVNDGSEGEGEGEIHPADLDTDWKIKMGEAIAYLSGWQQGANPMAYAIRAAYLWQNGEAYHYDAAEDAPMCWAL